MKIEDLHMLIVEDDDFQRGILVNILRALGISSIHEAGNGRQALDIIHGSAASAPINVALCDLNMPEMDGMEFLRHLGTEHQRIAVIITSALDGKLLSSVGRMTGMYGINLLGMLEKPILLANLKELLLKYDHEAAARVERPAVRSFTLDEILLGIRENQFEPYFQPKVELKSCRLVGAEALARWIHPEHGVISPYAFIPLLEQTRNIDDLTLRILEKSAEACRSFHERGQLLSVSVNLSLASLDDTALADKITQLVRASGIDPQYIVLEITESAAMTNVAPALENLARLCMNGFSLSIDDYGTGASNLQQLTRIAFSELKIDQSFVKDFYDNKALRIVVESSIDMAHKLQVKSVAEGVETQQDWDALQAVGCDTVQGYFIAEPMELNKFSEFAADYRCKTATLPHATATYPISQPGKLKLLVVDDDDFSRKIVLQVLHDLGFVNVVDAVSAEAALLLFEDNAFDMIITDINMPGMNGLKLIQRIRSGKTPVRPETRIMVLSSFSQTEVLGTALALDINGFLVKPVIPAVVEEKLAQAMSERFHFHSPIAYEAVQTDVKSLPKLEVGRSKVQAGSGATLSGGAARSVRTTRNADYLPLRRLRPGMVLKEDVYLRDGTLILSAGHTLYEVSINRLNDLANLLPAQGVAVHDFSADV